MDSSHSKDHCYGYFDEVSEENVISFEQRNQSQSENKHQQCEPSDLIENTGQTKKKKIRKAEDRRVKDLGWKSRQKHRSGRPKNKSVQFLHRQESKEYNHILYHYWRFILFLSFKTPQKFTLQTLPLTDEQNRWMTTTEKIMNLETFPSFEEFKASSSIFLLHSRSLHFVFFHHSTQHNRTCYSSQELKYIFLSFLRKMYLLSPFIYQYIQQYWQDIIFLIEEGAEEDSSDLPESSSTEQTDSEKKAMKKQLKEDDSIAAYQIACYLHACKQKFKFQIIDSK